MHVALRAAAYFAKALVFIIVAAAVGTAGAGTQNIFATSQCPLMCKTALWQFCTFHRTLRHWGRFVASCITSFSGCAVYGKWRVTVWRSGGKCVTEKRKHWCCTDYSWMLQQLCCWLFQCWFTATQRHEQNFDWYIWKDYTCVHYTLYIGGVGEMDIVTLMDYFFYCAVCQHLLPFFSKTWIQAGLSSRVGFHLISLFSTRKWFLWQKRQWKWKSLCRKQKNPFDSDMWDKASSQDKCLWNRLKLCMALAQGFKPWLRTVIRSPWSISYWRRLMSLQGR